MPLSFAQQRLWFLDQMHPQSPCYNVPAAFRIRGELQATALRASLRMIVARHEILRTVYGQADGEPAQIIRDDAPFAMPLVDLSAQGTAADWRQLVQREAVRPFDLEQDLMLRATLFKLGESDHVLFLNAHHIAFDEWSMQVLWRELAAGYDAALRGQPPALDELPIQYADFALWQREHTEQWVAAEQYWRHQLSGHLPEMALPTELGLDAARGEAGARESRVFPPELAAALRAFARREGVTIHVLLLAGFQILLRRYAGCDDIIVGAPVAGRTHFQVEPLIGFFVNTLPVRVQFGAASTFRDVVQRARQSSLEACEHQDLPFEQIVEKTRAPRRPNRNPIFDVVFSTQHAGRRRMGFCRPENRANRTRNRHGEIRFDARGAGSRSGTGRRDGIPQGAVRRPVHPPDARAFRGDVARHRRPSGSRPSPVCRCCAKEPPGQGRKSPLPRRPGLKWNRPKPGFKIACMKFGKTSWAIIPLVPPTIFSKLAAIPCWL